MISEKLNQEGIRLQNYQIGSRKTICPKCSHTRKKKKDPCLSVTLDSEGFKFLCHNCSWKGGGSANDKRQDFTPEQKAFKRPKADDNPQKPKSMYNWFESRCISQATVDSMQISITNKHIEGAAQACITYPYFREGNLINRKYRTRDKRFLQDGGTERTLYNIDALKGQTTAIWVEGEMDVLACIEVGITNVVSLPDGAPSKLEDQPGDHDKRYEAIANCDEFVEPVEKHIIAVDTDGPGKILAEELVRRLGRDKCWLVSWPTINDSPRKDANEVLSEDGVDVLRECIEAAQPYPIAGLYASADQTESVLDLHQTGRSNGLSIGFGWDMDQHLTIKPGDLTVITGHPSAGKSNWLDALMVNMASRHGWRFAVCSFENQQDEQLANLSEKYIQKPFWGGFEDRMDTETLTGGLDWLNKHFWFIRADQEDPTIEWILECARGAVRRFGVNGIVLDPWNEIEHFRSRGENETDYVSRVLGMFRRFAKVNGVHFFLVAHPSKPYRLKDGSYPVPSLYDISGSAHFANKADFGVTVHRPDETTQVEIHIRKVRHKWMGKRGMVKLRYLKPTGEYTDDLSG